MLVDGLHFYLKYNRAALILPLRSRGTRVIDFVGYPRISSPPTTCLPWSPDDHSREEEIESEELEKTTEKNREEMQEFNAILAQPKPKLPFLWPASLTLSQLNPIPYKFRPSRKLRMRQKARSAAEKGGQEDVTKLQTSFDVLETLRHLPRRQWKLLDLQHLVLAGFIFFCMIITPSAPLIKTGALVAYSFLLLMPITQQFFLPSLPIWTYLLYFFSSRYVVECLPLLRETAHCERVANVVSVNLDTLQPFVPASARFQYSH